MNFQGRIASSYRALFNQLVYNTGLFNFGSFSNLTSFVDCANYFIAKYLFLGSFLQIRYSNTRTFGCRCVVL